MKFDLNKFSYIVRSFFNFLKVFVRKCFLKNLIVFINFIYIYVLYCRIIKYVFFQTFVLIFFSILCLIIFCCCFVYSIAIEFFVRISKNLFRFSIQIFLRFAKINLIVIIINFVLYNKKR